MVFLQSDLMSLFIYQMCVCLIIHPAAFHSRSPQVFFLSATKAFFTVVYYHPKKSLRHSKETSKPCFPRASKLLGRISEDLWEGFACVTDGLFLWLDRNWVGEHWVKDMVLNVFLSDCLKGK